MLRDPFLSERLHRQRKYVLFYGGTYGSMFDKYEYTGRGSLAYYWKNHSDYKILRVGPEPPKADPKEDFVNAMQVGQRRVCDAC